MEKLLWKRKIVLFLSSQAITLLGTSIVQMALIWYVTLQTSSGIWITILTLASFLPQMLISLLGGVWADRYNKKYLIIAADTVIAVATLLLALYMMGGERGFNGIIAIVIISIIRSLGTGVQMPAVNSLIPQIVPKEHLMKFNGMNSSMQSVVQFASPAIAGAILATGSLDKILFIDVATAIIGVLMLTLISIPKVASEGVAKENSIFSDMKDGLAYTKENRFVGRILMNYGVFIFLSVPSGFLVPLMIERTFGDSYIYLSINEMIGFAGMVLGGLFIGAWGGFKNRVHTVFSGIFLYAVFAILLGLAGDFRLFAIVMFCLCLFIPIVQSSVMTILMENVVENMQGRIFSILNIMFSGFMPLGMIVFGPMSDSVKISSLMIISGIILAIVSLVIFGTVFKTRVKD